MSRATQDLFTWLLALGIMVSQALPFIPEKPYLIGGAIAMLGVVPIRRVQDAVNERVRNGEAR